MQESPSVSKEQSATEGEEEIESNRPPFKKTNTLFLQPINEPFSEDTSLSPSDFSSQFKATSSPRKSNIQLSSEKVRSVSTLQSVNTGEIKAPTFGGTLDEEQKDSSDTCNEKETNRPSDEPATFTTRNKLAQNLSRNSSDEDENEIHEDLEEKDLKKCKPYFRINGFTNFPPHLLQVSSYLCLGFIVGVFSFVVLESYPVGVAIPIGLIYYLELLILVVLTLWATWKDPTVATSIQQINARAKKAPSLDTSHFEYFCNFCQVSVGEKVKHCRSCNRDVYKFDHHCWWLNNCIGEPNYLLFIQLIVICSVFLFTSSITSLGFIIQKSITKDFGRAEIALVVISFGISFLFWVLITKLIQFHFYLYRRKMTTYEYIMEKRNKKMNRIGSPRCGRDKQKNIQINASPEENNFKEKEISPTEKNGDLESKKKE